MPPKRFFGQRLRARKSHPKALRLGEVTVRLNHAMRLLMEALGCINEELDQYPAATIRANLTLRRKQRFVRQAEVVLKTWLAGRHTKRITRKGTP